MTTLYIIIGILAVIVISVIVMYNSLVTLTQRVKEAWADIDVQLKRRYDLIPNLVESVKGYLKQEKGVLEEVTKARADAIAAGGNLAAKGEAENLSLIHI